MLTRCALLSAAALLLGAAPAAADSSFTLSGGVATIDAQAGGNETLTISTPSGKIRFALMGTESFGSPTGDAGCALVSAKAVECTAAMSRIVVRTGDQADTVTVGESATLTPFVDLDLGPGPDTADLAGARGGSTVRGRDGADTLEGGRGADVIDGGTEDDTLRLSAPSADEFIGGGGFDRLETEEGRPAIVATLDDVANDAHGGNVHADVEDLAGADGEDSITGSPAANLIDGGGGHDRLDGGAGHDAIDGGDGDDELFARDGLAELVGCGEGADVAEVDDVDIVTECETVHASADARPDVDADGVRKPADCDDANASIRPGAVEVLDDAVDQDCDGADAVDGDRDRDSYPRPGDCDDTRADVHPAGAELPGNRVDEDCDGTAAPFPRLLASVMLSTTSTATETRVLKFAVIDLRGGERIDVRCDGRGCPPGTHSVRARKRGRKSLLGRFEKVRLRPGAAITVRIARADGVANEFTARVRSGKPVKRSLGCVVPPRRTPKPC